MTGRRDTYADNDLSDSMSGVYKPGSVLKYTCMPGHVVVPVLSATRVCRKGKWDGQPGTCVRKTPRFLPRGSCPPPPLINNGYYLSERSSGEKPYVLPVSGHLSHQFEVGAIARSDCLRTILLCTFVMSGIIAMKDTLYCACLVRTSTAAPVLVSGIPNSLPSASAR